MQRSECGKCIHVRREEGGLFDVAGGTGTRPQHPVTLPIESAKERAGERGVKRWDLS